MQNKLSESEVNAIFESPEALQVLIDWHDVQSVLKDGCDMDSSINDKRIAELTTIKAEREALQKEWEA